MTSFEMAKILINCPENTTVFGSYIPGRPTTLKQKLEAEKANYEGYNKRFFYGKLKRLFTNKKGEYCFTVYTNCRYNLQNLKDDANYRCMNPNVGKLLTLSVIGE